MLTEQQLLGLGAQPAGGSTGFTEQLLAAGAQPVGESLPAPGSGLPMPGQSGYIPHDAPAWLGNMPTSDLRRMHLLEERYKEIGEGNPGYKEAVDEYQIEKALFDAKAKDYQDQFGEFQESGLSPQDYYAQLEADKAVGGRHFPTTLRGVLQGGAEVVTLPPRLANRAFGDGTIANYIDKELEKNSIRGRLAAGDSLEGQLLKKAGASDDTAEWLANLSGDAANNVTQSLLLSGTGALGGLGKMGRFFSVAGGMAAGVGDKAYLEALESGLDPSAAARYAATQASIEFIATSVAASIGNTVAGQAARGITQPAVNQTIRKRVASWLGGLAAEMGEEEFIEITSQINAQMAGVREPLTEKQWYSLMGNTAAQAAAAKGQIGAVDAALRPFVVDTSTPADETEATTATETAQEAEVRPESHPEPPTQQEATQELSEETTQDGVPEEAPAPPESGTMVPETAPKPTQEGGVDRVGEGGQAVVDNMYTAFQESLEKTGELPQQERGTNLGRLWDVFKGQVSPEEFIGRVREAQPETPDQWAALANEMVQDQRGEVASEAPTRSLDDYGEPYLPSFSTDEDGRPLSMRQVLDGMDRNNPRGYRNSTATPLESISDGLMTGENSDISSLEGGQLTRLAESLASPLQEQLFEMLSESTGGMSDQAASALAKSLMEQEGTSDTLADYESYDDPVREYIQNEGLPIPIMRALRDAAKEVNDSGGDQSFSELYDAIIGRPGDYYADKFGSKNRGFTGTAAQTEPGKIVPEPEVQPEPTPEVQPEPVAEDVEPPETAAFGGAPMIDVNRQMDPGGDSTEGIAALDIIKTWGRRFNVPIRPGKVSSPKALAIYKIFPETIRQKEPQVANMAVAMHEIAHHLDKTLGITGYLKDKGVKTKKLRKDLADEVRQLDYDPQKQRVFEGFAEFVRMYVTGGDVTRGDVTMPMAQAAAPQFYSWMTGEWAKANPEAFANLEASKQEAKQYADQDLFTRLQTLIGSQAPQDLDAGERFKERIQSSKHRLFRATFDHLAGLKELQDAAVAKVGDKAKRAYDTAMAYFMSEGPNAAKAVDNGVHDLATGELVSDNGGLFEGLQQFVQDEAEYQKAIVYSMARHTLFMAKRRPKYHTGMEVRDAKDYVNQLSSDQRRRYQGFATHLAEFNNDLIEMMVRAGAMPASEAQKILDFYGDNYMPLHRVQEKGYSGVFSGAKYVDLPAPLRGRTKEGSGKRVVDPVEATLSRAIQFYKRAGQARVQRAIVDTLESVPGLGFLGERIPPDMRENKIHVSNILDDLVKQGIIEKDDARSLRIAEGLNQGEDVDPADWDWFADHHGVDKNDVDAVNAVAAGQPSLESTVSTWTADYSPKPGKRIAMLYGPQGEKLMYQFDEQVYESLAGATPQQLGPTLRLMRAATQYFKAGAVGLSTGFGAANLFRDYFEYQGKAANVKGADSAVAPWRLLGAYLAYKSGKAHGDHPLFTLFDEMGGQLYSRVAQTQEGRSRLRREKFGDSHWSVNLLDFGKNSIERMESLIAISDAPARLAELEAAIQDDGYVVDGKGWREVNTGKKVDHLPEQVRIRGMLAAAEATVNFKRVGSAGRKVEAALPMPFFNATLQSMYRQGVQLKPVAKKLFSEQDLTDAESAAVARVFTYNALLMGGSLALWAMRHDDDDYREQEKYLRDAYWSWGHGGKTYLRVPKPRDFALAANLVEGVMDTVFHDDARPIEDIVMRDVQNRVPSGGGPLWGAYELATNWDNFRDREIVPPYLSDELPEDQYSPYTTPGAKAIGQVTGPYLGWSPLEVDHALNASTGGMYRRVSEALSSPITGDIGPDKIPGIRGLVMDRHQARSLTDFYDEMENARVAAKRDIDDPEKVAQAQRLSEYGELMAAIRKEEPRKLGGKRDFSYQKYLVGLAREALGREPLESNPSPLAGGDVPPKLEEIVVQFAADRTSRAILAARFPTKMDRADGKSIDAAIEDWKALADHDSEFLANNIDNPLVRKAVVDAVFGERGKRVRKSRMPRLRQGETRQEYAVRLAGWQESKRRMALWEGMLNQG